MNPHKIRMNFMTITAAVMLLVLSQAGLAFAQAIPQPIPQPSSIPTIEVVGNAETRATPDLATLIIAIETHASTAALAGAGNAKLSNRIAQALKDKLGDRGTIQTGAYALAPDYRQREGEMSSRIVGYGAMNSVTVETQALDLMGPLIDAALGAGANRIESVNFSLRNNIAARGEAIANAAKDAQGQAQVLATALGIKLKRVLRASTQAEPRPLIEAPMPSFAAARGVQAPTPITPGQITVPATVFLTYEVM